MKDTTKKDVQSISQMLQKGLDELFSGDKFRSFLKMTARFPNYSYRNILLLLRQCPHATKVMGFRSWMMNGRMVRSGEKALRIIAPFVKEDERKKKKTAIKKQIPFGESASLIFLRPTLCRASKILRQVLPQSK